jgi:HTH-type transcriptional regulator, transcriptional repressor of NAD biosynthesis genes
VFNKGFVFGKFYPLHKGHLAMIQFAKSHCAELFVLVCCSDKEIIPAEIRGNWLREEFAHDKSIHIIEYSYDESNLPNTSVSDRAVSRIWASEFASLLPDVDLLVTSEIYGDYVAEFMNIQHRMFDVNRSRQDISASSIRDNMILYWDFLPDSVKRFFQKTIIISGTESTGKTTLAKYLGNSFPAIVVEEVARELIADSNNFTEDDLIKVAEAHADAILVAKQRLNPFVIIDTDVYITQSYADFALGKSLNLPNYIYQLNEPDLRLYLDASVPYIQDGGRLTEADRNQLDSYHRKTLERFNQGYCEVGGSDWQKRSAVARDWVEKLVYPDWFY